MKQRKHSDDQALVGQCLAGSENAWCEFYTRFIGLMRTVVKKYGTLSPEDVEDVTQSAFLSLATALKNYDFKQSLPKFVSVVTQRVLIDELRRQGATKRGGQTELSTFIDHDDHGMASMDVNRELQDRLLEKAQLIDRVSGALGSLDGKCRKLITLRYLREMPFKEIAARLGSNENTVTVQTRRCLDYLRARFIERERRGPKT